MAKRRRGQPDKFQREGFSVDERPATEDDAASAVQRFVTTFVIGSKRERMLAMLLHKDRNKRNEAIQTVYKWIDPRLQHELPGNTGFPQHLKERFAGAGAHGRQRACAAIPRRRRCSRCSRRRSVPFPGVRQCRERRACLRSPRAVGSRQPLIFECQAPGLQASDEQGGRATELRVVLRNVVYRECFRGEARRLPGTRDPNSPGNGARRPGRKAGWSAFYFFCSDFGVCCSFAGGAAPLRS